jgi:hypothetical protein
MEFGISLYDALVSASVPPDKAKAVVQAMEKEMFDRLATKQDLQSMKQEMTLQLTLRMGGMIAAGFTIMVALLKLIP